MGFSDCMIGCMKWWLTAGGKQSWRKFDCKRAEIGGRAYSGKGDRNGCLRVRIVRRFWGDIP